jgi:hypothetical protein
MPENPPAGLIVMIAGLVVAALGLLIWTGALSWFGRLPGDIRIERPGLRVYAPITSMILISIGLSAVAALIRWLAR